MINVTSIGEYAFEGSILTNKTKLSIHGGVTIGKNAFRGQSKLKITTHNPNRMVANGASDLDAFNKNNNNKVNNDEKEISFGINEMFFGASNTIVYHHVDFKPETMPTINNSHTHIISTNAILIKKLQKYLDNIVTPPVDGFKLDFVSTLQNALATTLPISNSIQYKEIMIDVEMKEMYCGVVDKENQIYFIEIIDDNVVELYNVSKGNGWQIELQDKNSNSNSKLSNEKTRLVPKFQICQPDTTGLKNMAINQINTMRRKYYNINASNPDPNSVASKRIENTIQRNMNLLKELDSTKCPEVSIILNTECLINATVCNGCANSIKLTKSITLEGDKTEMLTKNIVNKSLLVLKDDSGSQLCNFKQINITGYKGIDDSAFANNKCVETVLLDENIEVINENAFSGCSNLKECNFSEMSSMNIVKDTAFVNCISLKNIKLPLKVVTVGDKCFMNCRSLVQVDLPKDVKAVGPDIFKGCTSLKTVNFMTATQPVLTNIVIPGSVDKITIDDFALSYNSTSTSVTTKTETTTENKTTTNTNTTKKNVTTNKANNLSMRFF